jgi:hypothetical protein
MRSRDFRKILHVACAAIIVAAALDFGASAPAHASTFQFNGQCDTSFPGNCSGTGRGTLVLTGYTQGTTILNSNFVSFTYTSDVLSLSFSGVLPTPGGIFSITGNLQNLPGPANVDIMGTSLLDVVFHSTPIGSGNWCAGNSGTSDCTTADIGHISQWSVPQVPLPTALPLFATGLAGLGLLGWRRKKRRCLRVKPQRSDFAHAEINNGQPRYLATSSD